MDLASVTHVLRPTGRHELPPWRPGDAWLAGGTWLFSDPPGGLTRLIDLEGFGWAPLVPERDGLAIAATCRVAELYGFEPPPEWPAAALFRPCCEALQSSFKIWNTATVGGNLCLSLPPGTLIALAAALEGRGVVWCPDGGERQVDVIDFVTDINCNVLRPGELLRAVMLPAAALRRHAAFRHATSSRFGRSTVLLIGTRSRSDGSAALTIGAATRRPVRLAFPDIPGAAELRDTILSLPAQLYFDDAHATAEHRRRLTLALAEEVRLELGQ